MPVTVYTTSTCPFCKKAKNFLEQQGIDFEEVDVETNEEAAKEMIQKSGQMGVPVLDVEGEIIVGFDKKKLETILKQKTASR